TPDGRYLIFSGVTSKSGLDVMALQLTGEHRTIPLLQSAAEDLVVAQSTDGRSILIQQESAGRVSISIARLRIDGNGPALGPLQTLAEGIVGATLRPDGREVFVRTLDSAIKAISLTPAAETMTVGATTMLFKLPAGINSVTANPTGTEFV